MPASQFVVTKLMNEGGQDPKYMIHPFGGDISRLPNPAIAFSGDGTFKEWGMFNSIEELPRELAKIAPIENNDPIFGKIFEDWKKGIAVG